MPSYPPLPLWGDWSWAKKREGQTYRPDSERVGSIGSGMLRSAGLRSAGQPPLNSMSGVPVHATDNGTTSLSDEPFLPCKGTPCHFLYTEHCWFIFFMG